MLEEDCRSIVRWFGVMRWWGLDMFADVTGVTQEICAFSNPTLVQQILQSHTMHEKIFRL